MKKLFAILAAALVSAPAFADSYVGVLGSFQKGDPAIAEVAGTPGTPATMFSPGTPGTPGVPGKAEVQRIVGSVIVGTIIGVDGINAVKTSPLYAFAVEGEAIKLSSSTVLTVGIPAYINLDVIGLENASFKAKAAYGSGNHGQVSLAYEHRFVSFGSPIVLSLGATKLSGHDVAPQLGVLYQF